VLREVTVGHIVYARIHVTEYVFADAVDYNFIFQIDQNGLGVLMEISATPLFNNISGKFKSILKNQLALEYMFEVSFTSAGALNNICESFESI